MNLAILTLSLFIMNNLHASDAAGAAPPPAMEPGEVRVVYSATEVFPPQNKLHTDEYSSTYFIGYDAQKKPRIRLTEVLRRNFRLSDVSYYTVETLQDKAVVSQTVAPAEFERLTQALKILPPVDGADQFNPSCISRFIPEPAGTMILDSPCTELPQDSPFKISLAHIWGLLLILVR